MEEYTRKFTTYGQTTGEPGPTGSLIPPRRSSKSQPTKNLGLSFVVASALSKAARGALLTSKDKSPPLRFIPQTSTDALERLLRLNTIALILTLITTLMSLSLLVYLALELR